VLLALGLPALVATVGATVALSSLDTTVDSRSGSVRGTQVVVQGHNHKHAGTAGHLQSTQSNVELVSTIALKRAERKRIADVGVFGGYAYLGSWGGGTCTHNGIHIVDLRNPARPRKAGFIAAPPGSYPGEGVQALHVDTATFKGDVLVTNNETCSRTTRRGGLNLYDVTNPSRPRTLVAGFGDHTRAGEPDTLRAHDIHSVFAWDAGRRAYAVMVDNQDARDVDIVDISNPRKPVVIAEYDLRALFPQLLQQRPSSLVDVFHHDVVVKKIGARHIMLVSYWDGGYVKLDVTDPRKARYLADSDFATPDAELAAQSPLRQPPEGNAHQSELTKDNRYWIAADEDFGPVRLEATSPDGEFAVLPGDRTPGVGTGEQIAGPTRYVGRACEGDPAVPAAAGAAIAVVTRGTCAFDEKLARIEAKGYDAALVVNTEGAQGCGLFRMGVRGGIPAFAVERSVGFSLFDISGYDDAACRRGSAETIQQITVGMEGDRVVIRSQFDGWGYVHLFRNANGKLRELDTYAIREAMDPQRASGSGVLSVHEVAASHVRNDLAYLSYYAGGLRVIRIENDKIVEAGRFIDVSGNNLWGVQVFRHAGREYVAASDIDFGLYVFRYTG
jgi:hypothetical protein